MLVFSPQDCINKMGICIREMHQPHLHSVFSKPHFSLVDPSIAMLITPPHITTPPPSLTLSVHLKTPSLIKPISASTADTHTDNPKVANSFTVSYLMNSCGFSQEKAITASKRFQLDSPAQPDSVLALFRDHDIPNTYISKIIHKRPSLLLFRAHKTLRPKLEFLNSIGICGLDLAKLISKDPEVLWHSLEKTIRPAIRFIKSIVGTDEKVLTTIMRWTWVIKKSPQKRLAPNVELLRTSGVPEQNICKLLVLTPSTLSRAHRFTEIVEEVKKMEFDPSKSAFVKAIYAYSCSSKPSWAAKHAIYEKWGWSEKEILRAFRNQPECMMLSERNIMGTMEFLVNQMGYDPLLISKCPMVLMFSLERRIIPRCSVIEILISNGLMKKDCNISAFLYMGSEEFLRKFVTKFEKEIPELLGIYQGMLIEPRVSV